MNNKQRAEVAVSEQNYIRLFSQAPAPIAILKGQALKYVFVNEAYSRIFNSRDLLGKTFREAFPELAGQGHYELLENVFDTGEPYEAREIPTWLNFTNDGCLTARYHDLLYTPYKNEADEVTGVMVFGQDVTSQVEARISAEETDQRFRNVVEQAPDPILILKGEHLVLEVANEPLLRLWQVGPEAIGKTFLEILPEMEDQGFVALLRDVYQTGETHYGYEMPAIFERKSGAREMVYFNFVYQPYREKDGTISGVIVISSDVTEQVMLKQQLVESEKNFRDLIMQAPMGIAIYKGEDLVVELSNGKYAELVGKNEQYLPGRPLWDSIPEAREVYDPLLLDVLRTGIPYHGKEQEIKLIRNGREEVLYLDFVFHPILDLEGSANGIMNIVLDVTDKVLARRKVEESEQELQLRVNQRTKELEKKNSELEQFAFVASHDLQEPLRKIKAFGELLKNRYMPELTEEGGSLITRMQDASDRMRTLINALLAYSQVSANQEDYLPVDLDQLLLEVTGDLETAISEKSATLESEPLQTIQGDALQLRQLLQNLLSNALKFSNREGVSPMIHIRSKIVRGADSDFKRNGPEDDRKYRQIEVSDNGIGFEPEYAEKIFQIFQRLHGKTVYPGSGVGLAIVRKVVDNHNGFIEVETVPGKGTTFRILLPL